MHKNDPKSLSHHGLKIGERGGLVIGTMKAAIICQVWLHFMHLITMLDKVYNINMHIYVL